MRRGQRGLHRLESEKGDLIHAAEEANRFSKGASHPGWSEYKDFASVFIHNKQIALAVKGQTFRGAQLRKRASHSVWSKFIDVAAAIAPSCHKQIARAVEGQIKWRTQSRGKSASHSAGSEFIDVPLEEIRDKQIARAVKS